MILHTKRYKWILKKLIAVLFFLSSVSHSQVQNIHNGKVQIFVDVEFWLILGIISDWFYSFFLSHLALFKPLLVVFAPLSIQFWIRFCPILVHFCLFFSNLSLILYAKPNPRDLWRPKVDCKKHLLRRISK